MSLNYSEQANVMIESIKDFDKAEFEKWYIEVMAIGSNIILTYIMWKKQQEKLIEEANRILKKEGDKNGNTKL